MEKKLKGISIGASVLLFALLVFFSNYTGATIGEDLGEFIYNLKH